MQSFYLFFGTGQKAFKHLTSIWRADVGAAKYNSPSIGLLPTFLHCMRLGAELQSYKSKIELANILVCMRQGQGFQNTSINNPEFEDLRMLV